MNVQNVKFQTTAPNWTFLYFAFVYCDVCIKVNNIKKPKGVWYL